MYKNCPVKKCNIEKGYFTCAECAEYEDLRKCKKLNNWISKIFGFIFRTDKLGNLERIREKRKSLGNYIRMYKAKGEG